MRLLAVVAAFTLIACGLAVQGMSDLDADAGIDGGSRDDASPDTSSAGTNAAWDPRCKGTAGPAPVFMGDYCIDRTEVTGAQYKAFFDAPDKDATAPPACSSNTSFGAPPAPDDLPVASVDWCDAHSYCDWAGKRLCTDAEGRTACGPDGRPYPYGSTYEEGRCNDAQHGANGPVAVASLSCVSEAGVHDMVGNVWEWRSSCVADLCSTGHGGAWTVKVDCELKLAASRDATSPRIGFRCCSDVR